MNEPARGQIVYGRHREHHIAGFVWHRDDREGHDDGRVWWSHRFSVWHTWEQVEHQAKLLDLVLIPLLPPGHVAGFGHSAPDGACTESCEGTGHAAA